MLVNPLLLGLIILIKSVVFSQCNVSLYLDACFVALKALFCVKKKKSCIDCCIDWLGMSILTQMRMSHCKKAPFLLFRLRLIFSFCIMTVTWNSRLVHFLQQHHQQSLTSPLSVSQHQALFDKLDTNYIELWNHPTDILSHGATVSTLVQWGETLPLLCRRHVPKTSSFFMMKQRNTDAVAPTLVSQ